MTPWSTLFASNVKSKHYLSSSFLETVFLPFVKEVRFRATEIDNFWTAISVFFLNRAFFTIVSIGHSGATAYHTASLIRSIVALVTNSHQRAWSDVRIANHAFAITFLTKSSNSHSGLFTTKYKIGMMFSHYTNAL